MIKLRNMAEYCKVSKNVQLIQNFNNMAKFAIKITKNPTLIKNPVEFLGNKLTLIFKCFNPNTNMRLMTIINKTTKRVNILGGSVL
jgi:maltodextrin utilization protein YvdJ